MDYEIVCEKEYYSLKQGQPTIGLLMMVKNEQLRIRVSLDSARPHVKAFIIFDTGSTDDTVKIIQEYCEKYKMNLYLIKGSFVDFSTSRNVILTYAEKVNVEYLVLLDCNDELKGGEHLVKIGSEFMGKPTGAFLLCQEWWSGKIDKYYNIRFVRNREGWRYFGRVHEYMKDTLSATDEPRSPVAKLPDLIVIYQDRTKDDDKSMKRFKRDRELLLKDVEENPKNSRALFYLSQTCQCLGIQDETLYYAKRRVELTGPGTFEEEVFHSYLRIGDTSVILNHDWKDVIGWYIRAYEHSPRAEPLVRIANYYRSKQKWWMAHMFAREACSLPYPDVLLFVDKTVYDYERWHVFGIVAYYVGNFVEGKKACEKAIETGINLELNKKNLEFYEEKLATESKAPVEEKKTDKLEELKKRYPNIKKEVLHKMLKKRG